ncbi:AraC family transcriptional regulator [Actibacterium sp. 188UL27-1]|uniref:helix-turn-helix domain-containing protein n=1 Tax=Actibacterium sp. 188UL27-1 TaxID=2786961 RepID=UPI00195639D4|nr:helix-turn-helix domain-containing protein [Actibacterium sp. 188UL27-1]MBM7069675.1 AraC family transcriptional regulator [Actibacterium sp. 188UL27-1]
MLVLPIPMIAALTLGFLLVQTQMRRDRPLMFSILLGGCALQAVIVSLTQYYGVTAFRLVQPVTAVALPPLAWVTFQTTAVRQIDLARDLPHAAIPAFVAFCVAFAPIALDPVVPAIFAVYGAALLWALKPGSDELPRIRLETGNVPRLIWSGIAWALLLSAISDVLIAIVQFYDQPQWQPLIISVGSSVSLLLVGVLSLSSSLDTGEPDDVPKPVTREVDAERNSALIAQLDDLIQGEQLFLDPDLTLSRLSKRMLVPAKQLSSAINQATGDNVSRYVNGFRIRHARDLLLNGQSVTAAMLDSGFNTKSNFNREFLRVMGVPPSAWLTKQLAHPPNPSG